MSRHRLIAALAALALFVLHAGCAPVRQSPVLQGPAVEEPVQQGLEALSQAELERRFEAVPSRYRAQALQNLRSYYAYPEVRGWLLEGPEPQRREVLLAVAFLFAYLPPADFGALTLELLREHVDHALKVRHEAPWGRQLTDELFYHYILPHRVTQEPCQAWRKLMHDELWPRVKNLPMQEAALEANRYAREYATFQSTNGRDQGPLTTMLRGVGRCEEEMILYICAARSVGIPARPCSTPYWTFTDNNHAWCEAFADGRWWFLGGCEPELELDRGWFAGPASRAGLVVSTAYGDVADSPEPVLARRAGVTLINSTPVYGDTCEVRALCDTEISGDIYVHIFNFGSLRVIARLVPGASIVLGRGDYVLTAKTPQGPVAALARTFDEQSPARDVLAQVQVNLTPQGWSRYILGRPSPDAGDNPQVELHHWLRFPQGARKSAGRKAATGSPQLTQEEKQQLARASQERLRARDQWRRERANLTPEQEQLIDALEGDYPARARQQLARCGANAPEVLAALSKLDVVERRYAIDVLELGDEKDCFEWTAEGLAGQVRRHRRALGADEEGWRNWVLAPRVRHESSSERGIRAAFSPPPLLAGRPLAEALGVIVAQGLTRADRGYFGSPANAVESARARRATIEDAAVCLVQVYRGVGLEARLASGGQWVEVRLDGQWLPAYPFEPENFGKVKAEAAAVYAKAGRVQVSLRRDGGEFPDAEPWRDFMLCRVEKGFVEPLEYLEWKNGACDVAPGDYVLFTGARSGRGDVCFRAASVTVRSGETTAVSADCTLVREELDAVELAARKMTAWPQAKVSGPDGKLSSLQDLVGEKPTLVLLLSTHDEPARRLLALLGPLQDELRQRGVALTAIYLGREGREEWDQRASEAGISVTLHDDAEKALASELGVRTQPAILLLTPGGETLLWHEGFTLHAPQLIKGALKWLR